MIEIETRGSALTLMGCATFQLPCPIFPSSILDHRLSGCCCAVVVTRGGPDDRTTTVMYEAVTAGFERQQIALSAAMSVVFFAVVLAITATGRAATRPS